MNITLQTNQNECGICVIKSLVDHYHHRNIKYDELLNSANITNEGINIYELELLALKYGIELDSYHCNIDELFNLNHKQYFIVIIKHQENNHYVIAKIINKNCIEIYCSIDGIYQLTKQEFEAIWANIYIKVIKSNINLTIANERKFDWNFINWKALILINVINILIILCSIFGSLFIEKIMELVINNKNLSNLLMIIITFLITNLMQITLSHIIKILSFKINYRLYQKLHRKTILILDNKYNSFFKKIDEGYIYNIDQYLYEFSNFYNLRLNQIIANTLLIISILIIVSTLSYQFLLILLAYSLIIFLLSVMKIKINRTNITEIEKNEAIYNASLIKYINFIKNNKCIFYSQYYINELKENVSTNKINAKKLFINQSAIMIFNQIIKLLFYLLIIAISTILITKNHFAISQLMVIISLDQMYDHAINDISNIYYDFQTLKITKKIITDIWNVDNISYHDGLKINQILELRYNKFILLNDTLISGANGIGKTTMLKKIASLVKNDQEVFINRLNLNLYASKNLKDNILYLSDSFIFDKNEIYHLLQSDYAEYVAPIISKLNLKTLEYDNLSLGQIQILNFLSLLNYKNKILLLDEILNHVDQDWKQFLLCEVKPWIVNNNYLIMVDHDIKKEKNYFSNYLEFNETIS